VDSNSIRKVAGTLSFIIWVMSLPACSVVSFSVDGSRGETIAFPKTRIVEDAPAGDSATVIASPAYAAGGVHNFFWGAHHREVWTTPVKVPVLDLSQFAGGLTPIKQGGGYQTKSLRLKSGDGREFAFRSVDKDPRKVLPPELQSTMAGDVMQDQISSSHPAAAIVVASLAGALEVFHGNPTLCLLPDDESLGEYRETFGGLLGVLEQYPSDGFAGAGKVTNTLKLFEALDEDSEDHVDSRAYLTARLLDIFVGDWDRHIDQWRWARFKKDGRNVWYPIPRDRDQAFSRLDGLFPWIGSMAITQLEGFYEDYNNVASLTFSGRFTDRRLLVDLDWTAWDEVTRKVINTLTDGTIENAVRQMPAPYYERSGGWLTQALKQRRDRLGDASREFYRLVADYVDIRLSDKDEHVEIDRVQDGRVLVTAHRLRKKTGGQKGEAVYRRLFDAEDTKEIRLYAMGGDDHVVVRGNVGSSILVRVIGGPGDDELVDESYVAGRFLLFPRAARLTYFYDHQGRNSIRTGPGTVVDTDPYESQFTLVR
jgi:hypothetical protein